MRTALAMVALLALAGCATTPPMVASGHWTLQASAAAGAALVWRGGLSEGSRIACRRNPADLLVTAPRLPPTAGPVVLEVTGTPFELTGDGTAPSLVASGSVPAALPAALMQGGFVVIESGPTQLRFPPPDAKTVAAFAIACRG